MIFLIAFRNLFRNIRRTVSILLTVALGTGALFCFDGFITGVLGQYRDSTIHAHYAHGQINQKGYRDQVYEKPWEHWIDNYEEVSAFLQEQEGVKFIFPRINFSALLSNDKVNMSGLGQGIDGAAESAFFSSLNIEEGKMLTDEEDGIILGKGLAAALNVKPGDRVTVIANNIHGNITRVNFTVTGIFHTGKKDFDDKYFKVPYKKAQILMNTQLVESISLGLESLENWQPVSDAILERFPEMETTSFADLDAIYYKHSVNWLSSQFRTVQIIILTIVLLGIFNSVSTTILERRQEIGNLRANGESSFDVMKLLVCEGCTLGFLGSLLGILIALGLNATILKNGIIMPPGPGLTRDFVAFISLQSETAGWTLVMGTISAFVATLLSGLRIARMPIGEALRSI